MFTFFIFIIFKLIKSCLFQLQLINSFPIPIINLYFHTVKNNTIYSNMNFLPLLFLLIHHQVYCINPNGYNRKKIIVAFKMYVFLIRRFNSNSFTQISKITGVNCETCFSLRASLTNKICDQSVLSKDSTSYFQST